jgi:hypothetical protein
LDTVNVVNHTLIGVSEGDSLSGLEDEIRRGILAYAAPVHAKTAIAVLTKGEKTMQGLKGVIAAAMLVAAAVSLGGCFGHHEQVVVTQPLKLN